MRILHVIPSLIALLWVPALVFDFFTGGRGVLIVYNLLPLFMMVSYFQRGTLSSKLMVWAAAIAGPVVLVGYRAVVRDQFTGANTASVRDRLKDIPSELLGGNETTIFDSLALQWSQIPGTIPFRGSLTTVEVVITALLPSQLFPKPERGSAVLTELLAPEKAARGGELTFSAAGDLYFGAGVIGVVVGFAFLGLLSGSAIRGATLAAERTGSLLALYFGLVTAASMYSVIRTDLYGLTMVAVRIGLVLVFVGFLSNIEGQARAGLGDPTRHRGLYLLDLPK